MRHGRRSRAAIALAAVLAACEGATPPAAPQPPDVTVAKPVERVVRDYKDFTGTVRATAFAEIRARVPGTLEEVLFEPSSFVEQGDVLFRIERDTYQAAFEEAQASLASAESQLASAESDLDRVEQAIRSNAVSQQELDRATAAGDQARAGVDGAKARLAQATTNLQYTEVRTPISGQVSRNYVDPGNLVGQGQATLLTTVTKIRPIYVYFQAPEEVVLKMLELQEQGKVKESVELHVATAADEGFPHLGVVDYIDNTVDASTGTIEIRGILPNDDGLLFPGLFVRVRAMGPERQALVIDERALAADLGGKYVLVVGDDSVVEKRYVRLGAVQVGGTVVVEDGLEAGERYITAGLLRARPGMPVTPEDADSRGAD